MYADLAQEIHDALDKEAPKQCPIKRLMPGTEPGELRRVPEHLRALLCLWHKHKVLDRPHAYSNSPQYKEYRRAVESLKLVLDAAMCRALSLKRGSIHYYAGWNAAFRRS